MCINIPTPIPKKPHKDPKRIYANLVTLKWKLNEKSGIENEEIAVTAIIIINIGETILADTAASPKTKAPTIPTVEPRGEGTLNPASLISSKDSSIINTSKTIGKGTLTLVATIEYNSSVGTNSLWYIVIAKYSPGNNKVIKKAIPLINFSKLEKW